MLGFIFSLKSNEKNSAKFSSKSNNSQIVGLKWANHNFYFNFKYNCLMHFLESFIKIERRNSLFVLLELRLNENDLDRFIRKPNT